MIVNSQLIHMQAKCRKLYFKTRIVQGLNENSTVQHKNNLNINIFFLNFNFDHYTV